jgi:hypothetical protein
VVKQPGDKTMCDVWLPVVESLRHSSEQHLSIPAALDAACEVADAPPTPPSPCRRVKAAPAISASAASGIRIRRDLGAVYGSDAGCRRQSKESRW